MKKVLVLTDFSHPSEAGIDLAFKLARKYSFEVFILHCMTEHTYLKFNLKESENYALFDVSEEKKLSAFKRWEEMAGNEGAETTFIVTGGDLVEGTNNFCKDKQIDLVIMGSTGRSQKAEQWGSNTDKMVKNIDYPLLIIKEKIASPSFKKILYASSFPSKEKECFQLMLELVPLDKNVEINLVSIDTESFFSQPSVLMNQVMNDYIELASPLKTKKHFYQSFNVKSGISKISEDLQPDLVVMSNKVRKPIKRILMGNDAVNIAHTSPYPVLIINYPD